MVNDASKELSADVADFADVGPIVDDPNKGYAAYSIGNENVTKGNHFFYVALGINFD